MLCNLCNSWFHLVADCPYRTQATSFMFEAPHMTSPKEPEISVDNCIENPDEDSEEVQDHHADNFFAQIVEQQSIHSFTGLKPSFGHPKAIDINYSAYPEGSKAATPFLGICIDERASESICGKPQYEAYLRTVHIPTNMRALKPCATLLRFVGKSNKQLVLASLRQAVIRIPVPGY